MKTSGWSKMAMVLAVALVMATVPAAPARADSSDSAKGAGVALGLMVAVVVVYGLVSLTSDVERFSQAETEGVIERAARRAEESPLVLQAITAPVGLETGGGAEHEIAGAGIGWRKMF